jgi:hypothetical protein
MEERAGLGGGTTKEMKFRNELCLTASLTILGVCIRIIVARAIMHIVIIERRVINEHL